MKIASFRQIKYKLIKSQRGSYSVEALLVFTVCFVIIAVGMGIFCDFYDWIYIESVAWQAADSAAARLRESEKGLYAGEWLAGSAKSGIVYGEKKKAKAELWEAAGESAMPAWLGETRQTIRDSADKLLMNEEIEWSITREEGPFGGVLIAEMSKGGWLKKGARAVAMTKKPVDFIRKVDLIMEQGSDLFEMIIKLLPISD